MKTEFSFTESISKEKVILIHDKNMQIDKETRKDHLEWTDGERNPLINRDYIVIRYPKSKKVDWSKWENSSHDTHPIGFVRQELENEVELLFYNQITFTWRIKRLEAIGLLKVVQRVIPDWKEYGELFPLYINAKGVRQWSYNLFFGLLELPFVLYKEKQEKRKMSKALEQ